MATLEPLKEFLVAESEAGERLDRVVAARFPDVSRTRVKELAMAGLVRVGGQQAKTSHRLRAGERVSVELLPRPALRAWPEAIPLDVLYEDEELIAVNKPAGMTVHAGAGKSSGTLVNALLGRGQALAEGADRLRPGIVHRLDKETSGVMVIAKTDFAHAKLGEAFRARKIQKTYIALVEGELKQAHGQIALRIGRDVRMRVRMTARGARVAGRAREALTEWRVLARIAPATLVEVRLHTGRTHQIRVHFSAIGHPVVGDTLYGAAFCLVAGKFELPELGRNFLHAAELAFQHPRTGKEVVLRAPLPPELRLYLKKMAGIPGQDSRAIDAALAPYL
jgi:23S rRNA pseudouridine1911/1915/1917 synthase